MALKIQQAQLEQRQHQQHFGGQQPFAAFQQAPAANVAAAAAAGPDNSQDVSSFAPFDPQNQKYQNQQHATPNRLLGTAFSPSNEVSHVKYSSDASNYDF